MHAKFARTLRLHMRDADLYTNPGTHVWTAEDSEIADLLLQVVTTNPTENTDENLLSAASTLAPALETSDLSRLDSNAELSLPLRDRSGAPKLRDAYTAGTINNSRSDINTTFGHRD